MSVLIIATAPGREEYEKVTAQVGDPQSQEGVELHIAAERADGSVYVVTVFESAEAADTFEKEKLLPAFQAVGVMPEGGPPERCPVI